MIRVLGMLLAGIWRLFRSLWTDRRCTLLSSLPYDECLHRLGGDLSRTMFMGGEGPIIGTVSDNQVTLRRRIAYGNAFATIVFAAVNALPKGGSELRCLITARGGVRAVMALWVGGIILFSIVGVVLMLTDPNPEMWIFAAVPVPLLTFGVLLVALGRYLARDDDALIVSYLRRRLEAQ